MTLKFEDPPAELHPNILLYGPAKTGKTTAASTWPGGKAYLSLDTRNALRFARDRDTEGSILPVTFEGKQTLTDLAHAVEDLPEVPDGRIFDAVVADPIGDLHRKLLEEASNRAVRPAIQDYGDVAVTLERWCRYLCEADVTAIFICHDHPVRDETTGELTHLPWTGTSNPALGQKLLGMVDIVGYTGVIQQKDGPDRFVAQLRHGKGRVGGDRFNVLAPVEDLDLSRWYNLIHGRESAQQQQPQEALR